MYTQQIRALAICVLSHQGKILVHEALDPASGTRFYRPLDEGIEFGETSAQAVVREIREELNAEIVNLRYIGTLENIFTYVGKLGHEIVQVYDGEFSDPSFYSRSVILGIESSGQSFEAFGRNLKEVSQKSSFVPNGLLQLLANPNG